MGESDHEPVWVRGEITLGQLLKLAGVAETGGHAKELVRRRRGHGRTARRSAAAAASSSSGDVVRVGTVTLVVEQRVGGDGRPATRLPVILERLASDRRALPRRAGGALRPVADRARWVPTARARRRCSRPPIWRCADGRLAPRRSRRSSRRAPRSCGSRPSLVQDDGARVFAAVGYDRSGERRVSAAGHRCPTSRAGRRCCRCGPSCPTTCSWSRGARAAAVSTSTVLVTPRRSALPPGSGRVRRGSAAAQLPAAVGRGQRRARSLGGGAGARGVGPGPAPGGVPGGSRRGASHACTPS